MQKIVSERMSLNNDILNGDLALDTGVIVEMLLSSDIGGMVTKALVAESAQAHSSEVNLAEALYVLCRKLGWETAESKLHNLRQSNYVSVADTEHVSRIAAQIKCERALALGDCFTFATAKATSSRALFASREKELLREMKRRSFDVQITFLEELMK